MQVSPTQILHPVIGNQVWIAQNMTELDVSKFRRFTTKTLVYQPFCDDFGPLNMSCVIKFIKMLELEISSNPKAKIAYCIEDGPRALTNAVFLIGAYVIIKQNAAVSDVVESFRWLDKPFIEPFRDATFSESDFGLSLVDCWSGLKKGCKLGWIRRPANSDEIWGEIDVDEYDHYENPLNGDLHMVVPSKFVAFKGPRDLGGREYRDDTEGHRDFSPPYYVDIFHTIGVTGIVRLNEHEYDESDFLSSGLAHVDLEFEDCTAPPPAIVAAFFKLVDSHSGLVAVHCKAGLGRTGTLIALYLMRRCKFTAREAIAWLRIMRPGSVIGQQQHYLCSIERTIRQAMRAAVKVGNYAHGVALAASGFRRQTSASFSSGTTRSRDEAADVAAGMQRRNSLRSLQDALPRLSAEV